MISMAVKYQAEMEDAVRKNVSSNADFGSENENSIYLQ
jgi:hypothetical protein